MKKKTPAQKYIDKAVEQVADKFNSVNVTNCHFQTDVHIDEAVITIAKALEENAIALGKLASSINGSTVNCLSFTTERTND